MEKDALHMAQLQCEAREIMQERFELARQKQVIEDELLTISQEDKRIYELDKSIREIMEKAQDLVNRSEILADSIKKIQYGHWQVNYNDLSDRQKLDSAIANAFKQICPE